MGRTERHADIAITLLEAADSRDGRLVDRLTRLVNGVYATAERGLWRDGATRTRDAEMADLIAARQIAVATRDWRIVGAVRVHDVSDDVSEFGMLVADADQRGTGVGRALVDFAERHGLERGRRAMQLELLVPRAWRHPAKEFLRAGTAAAATASPAPARSPTRIRTWRRCSPRRATSRSTRSHCGPERRVHPARRRPRNHRQRRGGGAIRWMPSPSVLGSPA